MILYINGTFVYRNNICYNLKYLVSRINMHKGKPVKCPSVSCKRNGVIFIVENQILCMAISTNNYLLV